MANTFGERIRNAWNAFQGKDYALTHSLGPGYSRRIDRPMFVRGTNRSLVNTIFNRIAMDVSALTFKCVYLDDNDRFLKINENPLNECLTVEANRDQTGRAFIQDVVTSCLDEGVVAVVPTDTSVDPRYNDSYKIYSLRTAKILEWYSDSVRVRLYREKTNSKEELVLPKASVAIIENPLYSVVNENNSVFQQLVRKLNLLNVVDEQSCSGKMDLIIQLPYVVKTPTRMAQAEQRRRDIENQLTESKYGVAYIDGTERVTQLNRSVENNLLSSIEYLTKLAYSQLGITEEILNGTASEAAMLNYTNRTIEPIASAIVDEMKRKFITKTARTQGQSIMFFNDPFKLVPLGSIAEIADKFTRNEIMTSNELRQRVGLPPSDDPKADQLVNSNIAQPRDGQATDEEGQEMPMDEYGDEGEYADEGEYVDEEV